MPETSTCTILRTPDELHAVRPAWEQLWRSDPNATPFQSSAWLLPWWNHFGEGRLRVAAVHRSGSLCALLPFYFYTEPLDSSRKLFPLGIATSDYLDGIFAPDCSANDILTALQCLSAEEEWDSFELTQLRRDSPLHQALRQWRPAALRPGGGEQVSQLDAVPLAQLPLKIRRNAMYYRNRAARAGSLELRAAGSADWLETLEALEKLHTARWNETGEPGVLVDPRVRASHREAIPQLLSEDLVRLYSLRLNDEMIAALYTFTDPPGRDTRSLYIYITGFSPAHAHLRPGSVILALTIDAVAQQGFTTVDFLRGNEPYKTLWHPRWIDTDSFLLPRPVTAQSVAA